MFTKIKEFLFGKDPVQSPAAAPYKVDTPAEVGKSADDRVEAPAPVAEAKPAVKAPAKKAQAPAPKAKPSPKAPPKPRAPRKPVAK